VSSGLSGRDRRRPLRPVDDEEAYLVARAPNPFASVCGRVCAAPCEDACRRADIDAPVSIRGLKRFVCERYGVESTRPDTQDRLRWQGTGEGNRYAGHLPIPARLFASPAAAVASRQRVAVIGAGPAGMAAAHDLALLGYSVTVFESAAKPGGMMRFGIPEYRLPRTLIESEIDRIVGLGVELQLETPLSAGFGIHELRRLGFEAIFLSVGVSRGRDLDVPGAQLDGVVRAVDYLLNVNRGYRLNLGERVIVIGGGFVAFDAARTAVRDAFDSARAALRGGAGEVTIVSLENFDEMPVLRTTQGHEEFEEAKKEGIRFLTRRGPLRFRAGSDGRLAAVELRAVARVFDADGRFSPLYDDGDLMVLDADACVLAIGQKADLSFLRGDEGVALQPNGTIRVDPVTLQTTAPDIFAGGDVAFGPRNLIEAVANGKRAARSMHEFLAAETSRVEALLEIEPIPTRLYRRITGFEVLDRETPPTLPIDRRTGIAEVETGYGAEAARQQAARCLVCHVQTIYDPDKCVLCNRCVDVCPEHCLAIVPFEALDLPDEQRAVLRERADANGLPLSAMVKDDDRCIRCGLCAIRCPTDAMTMERFSIVERFAAAPVAIETAPPVPSEEYV
jgi:NADPH-dependent glutamate synthase beta subunit-like oxidoreductase